MRDQFANANAPEQAREMNHQEAITQSLRRLGRTVQELDRTTGYITGSHPPNEAVSLESAAKKEVLPALGEFLSATPGSIDAMTETLAKLNAAIKNSLRI